MEHDNTDNNHDNNTGAVNGTLDNVENAAASNGNLEVGEHNNDMEVENTASARDNSINSNPARYHNLIE